MSKNIHQVYLANPITSNASTDLMYFGQSPYTAGDDAAMTYGNFSLQFLQSALPSGDIFVGNASNVATGIALSGDATLSNTGTITVSSINGKTISLGGSFATSGAFTVTQTYTGNTNVTFPTSGTLATTSQVPTGAPLTETNDTNVTLTLGGSPATALVNATSITAGWAGQLAPSRGGTGVSNTGNMTWGGAVTFSGAFASTFILTNTTNVTFPTSGTLATTTQIPTGAALTETNDTNITLTLGGSPTTALVNAASITAGWAGQLAVGRGGTGVASVTIAPSATAWAGWDANKNLSANNFLPSYTTTATSGITTTLNVSSTYLQFFTGSTTQTVSLPVANTLYEGFPFYIVNNSSGNVTVQSSGGNTVQVMAANTSLYLTCILNSGVTAASWNGEYAFNGGSGSGTVNSATINDLAYYATAGTAVSGLATVNSAVLTTSSGGVPTWSTELSLALGGTNANLTASNGGIFYSTASAGAILAGTATAGQLLTSGASTTPAWTTTTYPATNAINTLLYASGINTMAALATANSGVLVTSAGGVPSIGTTLPIGVQTNITELGTVTVGTWTASIIGLPYGGTNANLTASNGGIVYSSASAMAILSGTATAHQLLLSGASAAPVWSTTTYPTTNAVNTLLYASSANTMAALATANSSVLSTSSAGVPTFIGPLTNGQLVVGSTGATPVAATLTAGANISVTNAAGSITIASTGSASFAWNNVAASTQTLAVNQGYITNNGATLVTYTLPASAIQGSVIRVSGFSSGGWTIAQNASQEIFFGNQHTTIGVGGSLSSSNQYDQVELLCTVANTSFVVLSSVGNLTYV